MPQSLSQVWLHIIFSTKNRKPYLSNLSFQESMFRMLAHHVKETGCVSGLVGGHVDHVHLLIGLSRTTKICKLIETIKTATSKWAKNANGGDRNFTWQAGYGAFSVSYSNLKIVEEYIRKQELHHAKRSFKDEFRLLCEKHGLKIDERYAWD